jgi:hypothetical protein
VGSYADAAQASATFVSYGAPTQPRPDAAATYQDGYELFCSVYHKLEASP